MITYNNSVMLSPNGNWLKLSHMYSGVPITVPYEYYCDGHRVTGFNKYTLPDNATEQSSGSLPSVIYIRGYSEGRTNTGYRIESEKFDNVLTGVSFGDDPVVGLYLDGCYNLNNGTMNMYRHDRACSRRCLEKEHSRYFRSVYRLGGSKDKGESHDRLRYDVEFDRDYGRPDFQRRLFRRRRFGGKDIRPRLRPDSACRCLSGLRRNGSRFRDAQY